MGIGDIVNKLKSVVDQRGGTDALKQDANELKDIATGEGSLADKGKAAFEAVKRPATPAEQDAGEPDASAAEQTASAPPQDGAPAKSPTDQTREGQ